MSNKTHRTQPQAPLVTLPPQGIMLPNGETAASQKKIINVNPVGTQVLVELLTYAEQHPSTIVSTGKFAKDEARHGWVRKIGPNVKDTDWSFKVGDRVLISGNGTPVPQFEGCNDHEWVLLEPYTLKATLEEGY